MRVHKIALGAVIGLLVGMALMGLAGSGLVSNSARGILENVVYTPASPLMLVASPVLDYSKALWKALVLLPWGLIGVLCGVLLAQRHRMKEYRARHPVLTVLIALSAAVALLSAMGLSMFFLQNLGYLEVRPNLSAIGGYIGVLLPVHSKVVHSQLWKGLQTDELEATLELGKEDARTLGRALSRQVALSVRSRNEPPPSRREIAEYERTFTEEPDGTYFYDNGGPIEVKLRPTHGGRYIADITYRR